MLDLAARIFACGLRSMHGRQKHSLFCLFSSRGSVISLFCALSYLANPAGCGSVCYVFVRCVCCVWGVGLESMLHT